MTVRAAKTSISSRVPTTSPGFSICGFPIDREKYVFVSSSFSGRFQWRFKTNKQTKNGRIIPLCFTKPWTLRPAHHGYD